MVNSMLYGRDIKVVIKKGENNMFVAGDKVIVVNNKADTTRLKVGMEGMVLEITPHFVIVKLEDIQINLMFAPAEFFETFDKPKKREWGEWTCRNYIDYYSAIRNSVVRSISRIEVRHNGKTVEARYKTKEGYYIKAQANCSKYDDFDFNIGYEIALARLSQKLTQYSLEKRIEKME